MLNMGSLSINATSRIDGSDVAYFSASFSNNSNGNFSFSESVNDAQKYKDNQIEVDDDYEKFKEKALAYVRDTDLSVEME